MPSLKPRKLRIAFIGTGNISSRHIFAYSQIPSVEIVAGCDIKPDRCEWFRRQPGCAAARTYLDYREMLSCEKLDIVDVCTPNGVHHPATIAALLAGSHVMVEKPMAMTPAECEEMIAVARKNGRLLSVGFQVRYSPAVQMCKRAIDEGMLGDILYVKVHAMRRRGIPNWGVFGQKELQGGGPLIDLGIHQIESAHYVMGEPRPVAASGNTWTFMGDRKSQVLSKWPGWDYRTYTVEDLAAGQIRFENGMIMQVESSFCSHLAEDSSYWEIMGTKGAFDSRRTTVFTDLAGTMVNSQAAFLPTYNYPHDVLCKLQNFVSAVLSGTALCVTGEEGLAVQKMIDALYRSAAANGAEVRIQ